jgi:alpha-methylacyl-CoA racemase
VTERLGVGPDINYIALAGALYTFGHADKVPRPPTNIVGDYADGGMLLVIGMLCELWESRGSGRGQVVDAAMVTGPRSQ